MNEIPLTNKEIMQKANNALMCLTDLHDTNGRPRKPGTTPPPNKYEQLEKLKKLLDSGAITKEEYEREKEKILKGNN